MIDSVYLLEKETISNIQGDRKSHFLNENATRVNKNLGDITGLTGFGFHIIEVEPGRDTTEYHVHQYEDECVFVLEGSATAIIGDQEHDIGPGDFIGYRKGGSPHSICNTGDQTLKCIVVGERRAHDVCDYPKQNKRLYRNAGMPWNLVDHDVIDDPKRGIGSS